jgi:hypothetical protein
VLVVAESRARLQTSAHRRRPGASRDWRIRAVSASAFEFISENRQIASVHDFMRTLPDTLRR